MSTLAGFQLAVLGTAILFSTVHSEPGAWKTQTSKDGKVTVQSKVSSMKATNGDEAPVIEYKGSTTTTANFAKCVAVLLDVSNHKTINDDQSSRIVETVSDREWIVHYGLNVPWPLPQSDCVAKMTYTPDSTGKIARFHFSAAPSRWKSTNAKRMEVYELTYTIKDIGAGRIELSSVGKSSPPFNVPQWMLKAAFPASVADPLSQIVELARQHE